MNSTDITLLKIDLNTYHEIDTHGQNWVGREVIIIEVSYNGKFGDIFISEAC